MSALESEAGTLATSVTERLRAEILGGTLAPGKKLKVGLVSERYATGASPVREALNRLVADGLVIQYDQRGFSVAPVSLDDLRELVKTRCWLEKIALEQSIANRDADWEECLVLSFHRLSRTPRSSAAESYRTNPEWEKRHREFHAALLAKCGSKHLIRYCDELRDRADRYRQLAAVRIYPRRHEADEHKKIFDAAIEGRTSDAVDMLMGHYSTTAAIIEEHAGQIFATQGQSVSGK